MGAVIAVLLVAGALAMLIRWTVRTGQPITRHQAHRRALRADRMRQAKGKPPLTGQR